MKHAFLLLFLLSCTTGFVAVEDGSIEAFFCDKVDCLSVFSERVSGGVLCAMYHPSDEFTNILKINKGSLVVDSSHPVPDAVVESGSALMHDKFCVWDDFVWTGSWNPSQGMSIPNNVVLFESKILARAFRNEFAELHSGVFHGGSRGDAQVILNGSLIEAYFCPEDDCQDQVLRVLSSAKESVHFMTFSFTDDKIGDLLVDKSKVIDVKGVFDPRMDKYSEFEKLKDFSVKSKVHHKVFIVDGKIVITGSYNPSRNGDERNDENVVIIHNEGIAGLFEEEFLAVSRQ